VHPASTPDTYDRNALQRQAVRFSLIVTAIASHLSLPLDLTAPLNLAVTLLAVIAPPSGLASAVTPPWTAVMVLRGSSACSGPVISAATTKGSGPPRRGARLRPATSTQLPLE